MVFTCQMCVGTIFTTVLLTAYLSHLFSIHSRDPNFHVICGVDHCPQSFRNWFSLYRHCHRSHNEYIILRNDDNNRENGHMSDEGGEDEIVIDQEEDVADGGQDQGAEGQNIEADIGLHAMEVDVNRLTTAADILSIKEDNAITQVATDHMVRQHQLQFRTVANDLERGIQREIENEPDIDRETAERLRGRLTNLLVPMYSYYDGLETHYRQRQFYQKHFSLVLPKERVLGHTLQILGKQGNRHTENVPHVSYYVSLMDMLKVLLERRQYREHILQDHSRNDGLMSDYCDGTICQLNPIFGTQINHHGLQIILYYDEVELCDPNSSHKHKLGFFYFTLGNIEPKLRSHLNSINLLMIATSDDITRYGIDKILEPFFQDLSELSQVGLNVVSGEQEFLFKGTLAVVSADTPASHEISGFKEGVGFSLRKCRHCMTTFEQMQDNVFEEDFLLRNREIHDEHCNSLQNAQLRTHYSTTYGVNRAAASLQVQHFDFFNGFPQDVMHVILEGSMKYILREMLKQFIFTDNWFTLRYLNDRISQFAYSYLNDSEPSKLKESHLRERDGTLHQSAAQTWLMGRLMPFYIGSMVDFESDAWQCFSLLLEIASIAFSPVVCSAQVAHLKQLIAFFLRQFKTSFPEKNITPKMHYLVHLPQSILKLGPIVRFWCMRFEAKHKYFKRLAKVASFKNLPSYLAERHQYKQCRELLDIQKSGRHTLFDSTLKTAPSTRLDDQMRLYAFNEINRFFPNRIRDNDTVIYSLKWVEIDGNRYKPGCFVVPRADQELPVFCEVKGIWYDGVGYILRLEPYENSGIAEDLNAYEVTKEDNAGGLEVVDISELMVPFPMSSYAFQGKQYIPIKFDLTCLFSENKKM